MHGCYCVSPVCHFMLPNLKPQRLIVLDCALRAYGVNWLIT